MGFRLRFRRSSIPALASRYEYASGPRTLALMDSIPGVRSKGFLSQRDLVVLARWKALRNAGRVARNSDSYVRTVSRFALSTRDERARIEALTLLEGVGWPMASSILHFYHRGRYPVLDFRALEALSTEVPATYDFDFWWDYVTFCRELARSTGTDMRTLDRALWQWSKENG